MKNACSYFSPISSTQRGASARPRIKVAGALGQLRGMEQFERTAVRIVRIGSVSADLGTPETAAAPHIADMIRCEPLLEACPERRNGFANGGDNACSGYNDPLVRGHGVVGPLECHPPGNPVPTLLAAPWSGNVIGALWLTGGGRPCAASSMRGG